METIKDSGTNVKSDSISKKKSQKFSVVTQATTHDIDLYSGDDAEKLGAPIPLGIHQKHIVLWSRVTESIEEASITDIRNKVFLSLYCGEEWLRKFYTRFDNRTGALIAYEEAAIDLARKTGPLKSFSHSNCYATGCWSDREGGLVINSGDFCVDQAGNNIERIDVSRKRSAVYTTGSNYSLPPFVAASTKDKEVATRIIYDLATWKFIYEAETIGPLITAGWIVSAVYCAALDTRPSMWITGEAGSGKSMLFRYISDLLGASALSSESATSAGIRQNIDDSSVPVILDEFETSGTDQNVGSTKAILKSMRSAYTSKSATIKGTSSQMGKLYREQYPFAFLSVSSPVLESADAGRIVRLRMQPAERKNAVPSALDINDEDRARFMWSIWRNWDLYREILKAVTLEYSAQEKLADPREKDTYCTVIAGSALIYSIIHRIDNVKELSDPIANLVRVTLENMKEELEATRAQRKDYEVVYNEIMDTKLRVEYISSDADSTRAETMTIGMAVNRAGNGDESADNALKMIGIRAKVTVKNVDGIYTAIAVQNVELSKLLAGSRWRSNGSWTEPLKATPDCIKNYPIRFASAQVKAVLIPVKTQQ
ncbi:hypothetical protein HAP94_09980 [Acidithiobacillus ferrivorans]|nr:hypothetical protein [Acidithiobacillus ferrivorans]